MNAGRLPVLVGTGQVRRNPRLDGPCPPREPAAIMADAAAAALADAAVPAGDVQALACVTPMAWAYGDLCGRVGDLAGTPADAEGLTLPMGGNSPGDLLGLLAERIVDGEVDVAVLTGGEAMHSRRRAARQGIELDWPAPPPDHDLFGGQPPFATPLEERHGILWPIHAYPLLEVAVRARRGRRVDDHRRHLGELLARNAAVAATNPYAWFPEALTPEQITTPGPDNRMICFPYTKRMNAVLDVDLGAAVVVMSSDEADRRGVPTSRRVAYLGGGSAEDAWTVSQRRDLASSPGIAAACAAALDQAGTTVDEVDRFDLYSCFPVAVELATDALGIADDDPRGTTVTGGLAYAGGPGNSYSLHALAAMADHLRSSTTANTGLVTSLGMTASKHAASVLSADPGRWAPASGRSERRQPPREVIEEPELVESWEGPAEVESYTIVHGRDGKATRVIMLLRTASGARMVANGGRAYLELGSITEHEGVGLPGWVTPERDGTNRFTFIR